MNITKVELTDFRSHAKTSIEGLSRFNLFLGRNGAGKTSILEAIGYALTGTCQGTDAGGRGAEMLIRQDEDGGRAGAATVMLETDKGQLGRMSGQGPKSQAQSAAAAALGAPEELARVIVQPGNFLRMSANEQKMLLMRGLGGQVSAADMAVIIPPELRAADLIRGDQLTTGEAVDLLEKRFRAERPTLKGEISALAGAGPIEPCPVEGDPRQVLAQAQELLKSLRGERDRIITAQQAAAAHQRDVARTRGELDQIEADLAAFPPVEQMRAKINELAEEIDGRRRAAQARQSKAEGLAGDLARGKARLDEMREIGRKVSQLKGSCPTCQQPIDKQYAKSFLDDLGKRAKKAEAEVEKTAKAQAEVAEATLDEDVSKLEDDLKDLQQSIAVVAGSTQRRGELAAYLKKIAAPTTIPGDIGAVDGRIAKGEALIGQLQRHLAGVDQQAHAGRTRQEREKRLALVEAAVEFLGPKGPVRGKLLGGTLDGFVAAVQNLAAAFGLPPVSIVIQPWQILAAGRPVAMLSKSEEYRLGMIFAAVLSELSGAGLLLIDGADILDSEHRGMLADVLEACGLDQCFVASTHNEPEAVKAVPEGWSFYSVVKQGEISEVARLGS